MDIDFCDFLLNSIWLGANWHKGAISCKQRTPDGNEGILRVKMKDGREFSIHFELKK